MLIREAISEQREGDMIQHMSAHDVHSCAQPCVCVSYVDRCDGQMSR